MTSHSFPTRRSSDLYALFGEYSLNLLNNFTIKEL
jgi:hypothetical protein